MFSDSYKMFFRSTNTTRLNTYNLTHKIRKNKIPLLKIYTKPYSLTFKPTKHNIYRYFRVSFFKTRLIVCKPFNIGVLIGFFVQTKRLAIFKNKSTKKGKKDVNKEVVKITKDNYMLKVVKKKDKTFFENKEKNLKTFLNL